MAHFSNEEIANYLHSPVHLAVTRRDYVGLKRILSSLPRLAKAGEIRSETDAIAEELRAEAVSAVLDRRDVPGGETALHLAVRLGDATAAEILMAAGIDWSLQNEQGWSALQESICAREEAISMVIMRYYQPMAWAKWCRRLPRIIAAMQRMRDFYMELTFHFESSVIPFISRIAPSDTYRIWKCGSNLRADMTLAGFDGFRIQRSDQSFLFLGEGSEDGQLPPGSLCILKHKSREIINALEGAGAQPSEAEIALEVAAMSQTNMYRPGIDVTQAELHPQTTWRRQEKTEMVGQWKAKLYDMHHVTVSVKSRRVPGAMTDEELFDDAELERDDGSFEDFSELLTEDEKKELERALKMDSDDGEEDGYVGGRRAFPLPSDADHPNGEESLSRSDQNSASKGDKKGWFGWGRLSFKQEGPKKVVPPRSSLHVEEKVSDLMREDMLDGDQGDDSRHHESQRFMGRQHSDFRPEDHPLHKKVKGNRKPHEREHQGRRRRVAPSGSSNGDNEYKKGLRPVLWLTHSFPLKTEELLPLLDILANKVKAVRRLRELLTTKLPAGTFPVKVAIPVIPTIRVVITFTKLEDLQPIDKFATPPTTPDHQFDLKDKENGTYNTSSWFSWIKGSASKMAGISGMYSMSGTADMSSDEVSDPFTIPKDYVWTSMDVKKHKGKEKKSTMKGKKVVEGSMED
ncbi:hypothetical protein KP509_06G039300 [Ceratopteris richardii]|uniref:Ankyrin repeat domain-containing protein n=1 Tax=Ceratopteris richardii TaxID=49495 RepID=A0A8T2UHB4_CERRI|nr:hypothetical protein KP509_06G039300 [Ceratopteris richardii]KAH7434883.1 hypothetical protein KP509_06G039300 [Ceratopteris richardii]